MVTNLTPINGPIAFFLPSLSGGGAERVTLTLAVAFSERGYQVDLVLGAATGSYLNEVPSTIRVIDLGASRVALCLFALIRYLRQEKPTALISALNHANIMAIAARWFARSNTLLLVTEHNTLTSAVKNNKLRRERLLPLLMQWLYPFASYVIAVSKGVADDLVDSIGINRQKIKVVYNPVVSERLLIQAREDINESWFAADMPPVILAVGRLTHAKGFEVLIKAFAELRKKRPARLMILGEGEDHDLLLDLIFQLGLSEDVALLGFKTNPIAYMRQASLFVLSSYWEGLPTVLIEAMAVGTPVVSTNCPSGPKEILENGRWGRLVQVGMVSDLALAMEAALDDAFHPDVSQRARDFRVDVAVDQYLAVLKELTS